MTREFDPARRCVPVGEWPQADRLAWEAGLHSGALLQDAGYGCCWSSAMRKKTAKAYGRYLGFLQISGQLVPTAPPHMRAEQATIWGFIDHLIDQDSAPCTIHGYVLHVERAFRAMCPDLDLAWLQRLSRRLHARAVPTRNKRMKVRPVEQLLDLGLRLMAQASVGPEAPRRELVHYRDGLIIAFLSLRPLRRRTMVGLRIGHHLVQREGGYDICLGKDDIKTQRAWEASLPDILTAPMDYYLSVVRPALLKGGSSDHLWISWYGRPLADDTFAIRITKITHKELGVPIGPHLFRDCFATTIAIEDPRRIRAMGTSLQHSSLRSSERYYNQAGTIDVAAGHGKVIKGIRQRARKARSSRRS